MELSAHQGLLQSTCSHLSWTRSWNGSQLLRVYREIDGHLPGLYEVTEFNFSADLLSFGMSSVISSPLLVMA